MNNKNIKERIINIIRNSGILLLVNMAMIISITSILFFFKVSITKFHLPIIFLLELILFIVIYRKKEKIINTIIAYLLAIIVFIITVNNVGNLYDLTVDGNSYHKLAVGSLKNGWNPVYESVEDFNKEKGNIVDIDTENAKNFLWINHYTKGPWIYSGVVYAFTDNIESAKIFTIIIMYSTFTIVFSYLSKKINTFIGIIISLLLVVNPITIVQMFNYYGDGLLGLCIFIIITSLISITDKNCDKDNLTKFIILASAIIICVNIKFTGLAFAGIFCLAFYIYWLSKVYKSKEKEEFYKTIKVLTIFYTIVVLFSVGIIGFTSYVKNTIFNGHPFYPLYGEGKVDIITTMQPNYFSELGTIKKFVISMFSTSENICYSNDGQGKYADLKLPFTYTENEINNFTIPDMRIGGFGPLFGGITILSSIAIIILIIKCTIEKKYNILIPLMLILGCITILICIVEGSWWARYIPYFYLIPIIAITFLYLNKNIVSNIYAIILTLAIVINVKFIWDTNWKNYKEKSEYLGRTIDTFIEYAEEKTKNNEKVEIKLNDKSFQSVIYNLDDLGIEVVESENLDKNIESYFFKY